MCGIIGVIGSQSLQSDVREIRKSLELIKHRGPDDEGYILANLRKGFAEERSGSDSLGEIRERHADILARLNFEPDVVLGHRRLSILDLTANGHQPMSDHKKKVWIVHNGEIYNYIELRKELETLGHIFTTKTDTEVILAAYKEWGVGAVKKFNGMWAFAILDMNNKTLVLSRDRFGVKPMYYFLNNKYFAFASEIKSLVMLPFIDKIPNSRVLFEYLVYNLKDHGEDCFFLNIHQVLPAHVIVYDIRSSGISRQRYWQLDRESNQDISEERAKEHFKELFFDAVKIRLRSDVPVGSCLSGGLDSSSIVCAMSELFSRGSGKGDHARFDTYTAAYTDKKYDESDFASEVSRSAGTSPHFVYPDGDKFFDTLERIIWHQDEPFSGTTVYAQWKVMELAKDNETKVILDGQGNDELMGGYSIYFGIKLIQDLMDLNIALFLSEIHGSVKNTDMLTGDILYQIVRALQYSLPAQLVRLNRRLTKCRFLKTTFVADNSNTNGRFMPLGFHNFYRSKTMIDLTGYNLQELLHNEDRNSMAFSVETRLPFLDYRLVELVFALPTAYKMRNGVSKYILRNALHEILPAKIKTRKDKKGFTTPEKEWLHTNSPLIMDVLKQNKLRMNPFIDQKKMLCAFNASDSRIEFKEIFRYFLIEKWMRLFNL